MLEPGHPLTEPHVASTKPLTVRVREACQLTGISRSKLYELIKAGEIKTFKVGTMTLIPMNSLMTFLDKKQQKETDL